MDAVSGEIRFDTGESLEPALTRQAFLATPMGATASSIGAAGFRLGAREIAGQKFVANPSRTTCTWNLRMPGARRRRGAEGAMGGVYGEINSRADFVRVLREARTITRRMLGASPSNLTIAAIDTQLDAMERWIAAGGEPAKDQRERVNVGLIAVRELDADRQDESGELARKLCVLDNYAKEWPTDDQAARATDADYWARFGL